jgi:D-alanyl-D-alanine dipeptidase
VIRSQGNAFEFDGPLASGTRLSFENGSLLADNVRHPRQTETAPSECPDEWSGLIGEYGEDHNILYILEHRGQLCALIEWFFLYPLEPRGGDRFAFAGEGLYVSEEIVFERDNDGRGKRAIAAGIRFDRKPIGLGGDEPFRIKPLRPIDELRREIANAEKPAEPGQFRAPDLVELASLDPTLRFDIRYATERNFLGAPLYPVPRAYLQRPAAEALARAHRALANHGFGLWIHDAYRPWKITKLFWEATPVPLRGFVADPARGSRHNRGCAVDLTLYDLKSGQPVIMPSGYDEFTDRARPYYPGGTTAERWRRDLLRRTMEAEGFTVFEGEWWHFDFKDWASYPILDLPLESVPGG